jgi:hypothetical protein
MRRDFIFGFAFALASCWSGNVQRQQLPNGSWQLTCKLPMGDCVQQADSLCLDQRYRIVGGQSRHVLRGVSPTQVDYRASDLTIVCGEREEEPTTLGASVSLAHTTDAGSWNKSVCTPGATQSCVGPGACTGGQACRDDGSGFGPCDCGQPPATSVDAGVHTMQRSGAGSLSHPVGGG